jgi:amino acid transporter
MNRSPRRRKRIDFHFAWAMAVGGMIGGGIYTLAGVILGVAGPAAWLSLILGTVLALITVRSYYKLSLRSNEGAVPVTYILGIGQQNIAAMLSWWLVIVYVLAMGVYSFTFGHYVGRALGLTEATIALVTALGLLALVVVNLVGVELPRGVQIAAVWMELSILAALAIFGFVHWNPQNLTAGVPQPSVFGVLSGMAGTFIAFEGFEMISYDYRELKFPHRTMSMGLAAAVFAVGAAYAIVTLGAGSIVGAKTLVEQKENALAVAGAKAAGNIGLIVVTIAACASAASAINSTLFSVARFARSSAQRGLLPGFFSKGNRRDCPHYGVIILGCAAAILAATATLNILVQLASFAFLLLFCFVNGVAFHASGAKPSWLALIGCLSAAAADVIVVRMMIKENPWWIVAPASTLVLSVVIHFVWKKWRDTHSSVCDEQFTGQQREA